MSSSIFVLNSPILILSWGITDYYLLFRLAFQCQHSWILHFWDQFSKGDLLLKWMKHTVSYFKTNICASILNWFPAWSQGGKKSDFVDCIHQKVEVPLRFTGVDFIMAEAEDRRQKLPDTPKLYRSSQT